MERFPGPPGIPKPPRLPKLPMLRDAIEDARGTLREATDGIKDIASALRLRDTGRSEVTKPPITSPAPQAQGVSDKETLEYQVDHLLDELNLVETHLSEGGRIAGKVCDCIAKAGRRIRAYATESVPIAARQGMSPQVFVEMATWGEHLMKIGTPEAVESGQHDYPKESGTASRFRKELGKLKTAETPTGNPNPLHVAEPKAYELGRQVHEV